MLHAPEDKDIKTIDEMLGYAMSPGMLGLSTGPTSNTLRLTFAIPCRFPLLLNVLLGILPVYDLQGRANAGNKQSLGVHFNLLAGG